MSSEELGVWARKLPELFGKSGAGFGEGEKILVTPLRQPPKSRRPSSRANGAPAKSSHRILGLMRDISTSRGRSSRSRADYQRHIPRRSIGEEEEEVGPPKPDPEIDERGRYRYGDDDEPSNRITRLN